VRAETKEFGDIIRLDSTDTYADLARKTLKLFSKLPDKFDASFYFKVTTRLRNWGWGYRWAARCWDWQRPACLPDRLGSGVMPCAMSENQACVAWQREVTAALAVLISQVKTITRNLPDRCGTGG